MGTGPVEEEVGRPACSARWLSEHFGLGLAAQGTLAGLPPADTMIPVGTAGLGYHFAFR